MNILQLGNFSTLLFAKLFLQGFGNSDDVEEESGQEGSTKFEESEQAGLGEGEGAKDVSEQIETEDQLEDTKLPGKEQEKSGEKEKFADEEHGIEMSEDFDAEMDDVEKGEKEGEEGSEEEGEEPDVDDQMGSFEDNDESIEQLDKEFWGNDEEEEEDHGEKEKVSHVFNGESCSYSTFIWQT